MLAYLLAAAVIAGVIPSVPLYAETEAKPSGEGTQESPYKITSQEELEWIGQEPDAVYTLENDIALSGEWEPVDFSGVFDGQGHTVSGLNVPRSKGYTYAGLFGYCAGVEISNLTVQIADGAEVAGAYAGAVAGSCYSPDEETPSRITNCHSEGGAVVPSEGTYYAALGGLVGSASDAVVEDCSSSCTADAAEGDMLIAGMTVEEDNYIIENISDVNPGAVTIATEYTSSDPENYPSPLPLEGDDTGSAVDVAGASMAAISGWTREFRFTAKIPGVYQIGFLIDGKKMAQTVVTAYGEDGAEPEDIYTLEYSMVGAAANEIHGGSFGGLIGETEDTTILYSYATGNVNVFMQHSDALAWYTGGLIGTGEKDNRDFTIEGCAYEGDISLKVNSGQVYAGGLVGYSDGIEAISRSYMAGSLYVSGAGGNVGGLIGGLLNGSAENCFANSSVVRENIGELSFAGATNSTAGFVGRASNASLSNCYTASSVAGEEETTFAFYGEEEYHPSTFTNCYYDKEKASAGNSQCEGLSAEQMKSEGGMPGLEYVNGWEFRDGENDGYPVLIGVDASTGTDTDPGNEEPGSVRLSIPDGLEPEAYTGCMAELITSDGKTAGQKYFLGDAAVVFRFVKPGTYSVKMSRDGEILGQWDAVQVEAGKETAVNAEGLLKFCNVTVKALLYSGKETSEVQIHWYDGETEEYLSTGNTIEGVLPGKKLLYQIRLSPGLEADGYISPGMQELTVGEEQAQTVPYSLTLSGKIKISGTVSHEGRPVPNVPVTVSAVDGSGMAAAVTDGQGYYELPGPYGMAELYVRSGDALYRGEKEIREDTVWDVELQQSDEYVITLDVARRDAAKSGSEVSYPADGSEVSVQIFNERTGKYLDGYAVEYPAVYIDPESNVKEGDTLRIEVADPSGECEPVKTTVTLEKGKDNVAEALLAERGGIEVSLENGDEEAELFLYGEDGSLRAKTTAAGGRGTFAGLKSGDYRLVAAESGQGLVPAANIGELEQRLADWDINKAEQLQIRDGVISVCEVSEIFKVKQEEDNPYIVPESCYYGFYNASYWLYESVISLKVSYAFSEDSYDQVENPVLEVTLPEGITPSGMEEVSAGRWQSELWSRSEERYYFELEREELTEDCYSEAALVFTADGEEYRYPLGTVHISAEEKLGVYLYAPAQTNDREIEVTVDTHQLTDLPVEIYDNGVCVASVSAEKNHGAELTVPVTLLGGGDWSEHELYALVKKENGEIIESQRRSVIYKLSGVILESVEMTGPDNTRAELGNSGTNLLTLLELPAEVTYLARFSDPAEDAVKNVEFIIEDMSGEIHILNGEYFADRQAWGATMEVSNANLPAEVGVSFADASEDAQLTWEEAEASVNQWISTQFPDSLAYSDISMDGAVMDDELTEIWNEATEGVGVEITEQGDGDYSVELPGDMGTVDITTEMLEELDVPALLEEGFQEAQLADMSGKPVDDGFYIRNTEDDTIEIVDSGNKEHYTVKMNYEEGSQWSDEPTPEKIEIGIDTIGKTMEALGETEVEKVEGKLGQYVINQRLKMANAPYGSGQWLKCQQNIKWAWGMLDTLRKISLCTKLAQGAVDLGGWLQRFGELRDDIGIFLDLLYRIPSVEECPQATYEINTIYQDLAQTAQALNNQWTFLGADIGLGFSKSIGALPFMLAINAADMVLQEGTRARMAEIDYDLHQLEILCGNAPDPNRRLTVVKTPRAKVRILLDPSGYVYEGVPSNRVEGVTATIFYKENKEDETAVFWDAWNYNQQNPQITNREGRYAWDVPAGWWQVRYEKKGYITAYSEWMEVPPPRTEVNVPIVSMAPPEVKSAQFYKDSIELYFTQYMDLTFLEKGESISWKVTQGGSEVPGTWKAVKPEAGADPSVSYAAAFCFVPESGQLSGEYELTVDSAENYAGTLMEGPQTLKGTATDKPEKMTVHVQESLKYGETAEVTVQLEPGGANREIRIVNHTPGIVTVSEENVTTDANGTAAFQVTAGLPGTAELEISLEDSELTENVSFTVESPAPKVAAVEASPAGGKVEAGAEVSLHTRTPGAAIYYTLDGTCPCVEDSPSRLLYTGPIKLTEPGDVTLIAYAVKEGYRDGETSRYIYTVSGETGTDEPDSPDDPGEEPEDPDDPGEEPEDSNDPGQDPDEPDNPGEDGTGRDNQGTGGETQDEGGADEAVQSGDAEGSAMLWGAALLGAGAVAYRVLRRNSRRNF